MGGQNRVEVIMFEQQSYLFFYFFYFFICNVQLSAVKECNAIPSELPHRQSRVVNGSDLYAMLVIQDSFTNGT